MQLLNFGAHYLRIVFGNIWGILLALSTALGLGERFIEKKIKIPLWIRITLIVGIVFVAQAVAYKELADVPPTVLHTPTPPAPIIQKQELPPNVARNAVQKPDTKPPVQINSAPNGIAIGGGKVTNPTVNNFGTPSRRLTAQQIGSIRSSAQGLCSTLPSIPITAANANQEAQRYALDFVNALKSGGCTADLVLPIPGLMPDVVGVYVAVKDMSNLGSMAEALKQILSEARIPYLVAPLKPDFFSDKQTVLVIGASE